jgi:broad specificity phosphatase PhoE
VSPWAAHHPTTWLGRRSLSVVAERVVRVLVVQHGEKVRRPGDPGLTGAGRAQAEATARWLRRTERPVAVWSSPMRRAVETAAPIARELALHVVTDARLRERMNWEGPDSQPLDEFLDEWQRASDDRSFVPRSGDSSEAAAARFLAALDDLAGIQRRGAVVVVTHGGVTRDALLTLVGDEQVMALVPALIAEGVPGCAVTTLRRQGDGWSVEVVAATDHLARGSAHRPA